MVGTKTSISFCFVGVAIMHLSYEYRWVVSRDVSTSRYCYLFCWKVWILQLLRKEREMETVTCANCGQVHMVSVSVAKTVWNGQKEVTYHYCGQNCQQEDYLKKLVVQLYG